MLTVGHRCEVKSETQDFTCLLCLQIIPVSFGEPYIKPPIRPYGTELSIVDSQPGPVLSLTEHLTQYKNTLGCITMIKWITGIHYWDRKKWLYTFYTTQNTLYSRGKIF